MDTDENIVDIIVCREIVDVASLALTSSLLLVLLLCSRWTVKTKPMITIGCSG